MPAAGVCSCLFSTYVCTCSIAALSSPRYEVGDNISMKLMVREKASVRVPSFSSPCEEVCVSREPRLCGLGLNGVATVQAF